MWIFLLIFSFEVLNCFPEFNSFAEKTSTLEGEFVLCCDWFSTKQTFKVTQQPSCWQQSSLNQMIPSSRCLRELEKVFWCSVQTEPRCSEAALPPRLRPGTAPGKTARVFSNTKLFLACTQTVGWLKAPASSHYKPLIQLRIDSLLQRGVSRGKKITTIRSNSSRSLWSFSSTLRKAWSFIEARSFLTN